MSTPKERKGGPGSPLWTAQPDASPPSVTKAWAQVSTSLSIPQQWAFPMQSRPEPPNYLWGELPIPQQDQPYVPHPCFVWGWIERRGASSTCGGIGRKNQNCSIPRCELITSQDSKLQGQTQPTDLPLSNKKTLTDTHTHTDPQRSCRIRQNAF